MALTHASRSAGPMGTCWWRAHEGVAVPLGVLGCATAQLTEKARQHDAFVAQVLGEERIQHPILGDAAVEGVGEAPEPGLAAYQRV